MRDVRHGFPPSVWLRVVGGATLILVLLLFAGPPSHASPVSKRFDRQGIVFEYPDEWFATTRPLSNAVNPAYRFAVSSVPVRRTRADIGPCLPGIARQIPRDGILAFLREALGADRTRSLPRMPRRPASFRLPTRSGSYLCGFRHGHTRWIAFKDAGRAFYLGVYVGPEAPTAVRRALKRLLDGMEVRAGTT